MTKNKQKTVISSAKNSHRQTNSEVFRAEYNGGKRQINCSGSFSVKISSITQQSQTKYNWF